MSKSRYASWIEFEYELVILNTLKKTNSNSYYAPNAGYKLLTSSVSARMDGETYFIDSRLSLRTEGFEIFVKHCDKLKREVYTVYSKFPSSIATLFSIESALSL